MWLLTRDEGTAEGEGGLVTGGWGVRGLRKWLPVREKGKKKKKTIIRGGLGVVWPVVEKKKSKPKGLAAVFLWEGKKFVRGGGCLEKMGEDRFRVAFFCIFLIFQNCPPSCLS